MISVAQSEQSDRGVLHLFLETFDDIASDAVPMTFANHVFAPTVLQAQNPPPGNSSAVHSVAAPRLAVYACALPQMQTPRLARTAIGSGSSIS